MLTYLSTLESWKNIVIFSLCNETVRSALFITFSCVMKLLDPPSPLPFWSRLPEAWGGDLYCHPSPAPCSSGDSLAVNKKNIKVLKVLMKFNIQYFCQQEKRIILQSLEYEIVKSQKIQKGYMVLFYNLKKDL